MTSDTSSQVLHVSNSMDKTLANVKSLLKPYVFVFSHEVSEN
jgi:hypothetical protein